VLYVFKVSAPANTTYTNRIKQDLEVRSGIITSIKVLIPAGHHSLAHLILTYGDTPLAPEHGVEGIFGEDTTITLEPMLEITETPDTIKAEVWNNDDRYEHAFIIYVEIKPKWLVYPTLALIDLLKSIKTLLTGRRIS